MQGLYCAFRLAARGSGAPVLRDLLARLGVVASARTPEIRTQRLVLRAFCDADRAAFAALNADPRVMEHFASPLSGPESDAMIERIRQHFGAYGFGFWAVEATGVAPFIGFVGLAVPSFAAHFTPCVEIGWRLAAPFWGHGYATEAARAAVTHGFESLGLQEIVSFTTESNARSKRVMEAIGMTTDVREDFDHPKLPEGHHLRRHVLYRLSQTDWASATGRGDGDFSLSST